MVDNTIAITHKIILVLFNVLISMVYELMSCVCHSGWGVYCRFNTNNKTKATNNNIMINTKIHR